MEKFSYDGSRKNLLRSRKDLWDAYSIEKQITENYPKTFVLQCNRDNTVPIENTRLLAEALKEYGVPYIYIYMRLFHPMPTVRVLLPEPLHRAGLKEQYSFVKIRQL
jgi:hypothetical protein